MRNNISWHTSIKFLSEIKTRPCSTILHKEQCCTIVCWCELYKSLKEFPLENINLLLNYMIIIFKHNIDVYIFILIVQIIIWRAKHVQITSNNKSLNSHRTSKARHLNNQVWLTVKRRTKHNRLRALCGESWSTGYLNITWAKMSMNRYK